MAPTSLDSIVQNVHRRGPDSIERLRPEVWGEIEAKYWTSSATVRAQEDRELDDSYRKRHAEVTARIYEIAADHARLKAQISAAEDEWRALDDDLKSMEQKLKAERAHRSMRRSREDDQQRKWFDGCRRSSEAFLAHSHQEAVDAGEVERYRTAIRLKQPSHRPGPLPRPIKESPKLASSGIMSGLPNYNRPVLSPTHHHQMSPPSRPSLIAESIERNSDYGSAAGGFTAVNGAILSGRSTSFEERASRGRKSLPDGRMSGQITPTTSSTPGGSPVEANITEEDVDPPAEITKSILELCDDGTVFTAPATMVGVPVAKITPDHPYWDPEWKPIEDTIRPALEKWQAKHEEHLAKGSTTSSKFLANRQINRGNAILKFLQDGDLHPYQIFGKQYVNSNVRNFVNYDTLFRMVQVLEELPKFGIDCSPSQWLRQRLHEVYTEAPDKFNLSKTIHELYHDEKVMYLRSKSGFGNIGRPSGYKMGDKASPDGNRRISSHSQARKRKIDGTTKTTPRSTPRGTPKPGPLQEGEQIMSPILPRPDLSSSHRRIQPHPGHNLQPVVPPSSNAATPAFSQLQAQAQKAREYEEAQAAVHGVLHSPREQKKQRLSATPASTPTLSLAPAPESASAPVEVPAVEDDLEYDGYTSSDSYSGDTVMQCDWRVHQVKMATVATNPAVTQYWHWLDRSSEEDGETNMFEHQVLKDVPPQKVSWGVYKEPLDFHLRLLELTQVQYAAESTCIIMSTKEIPDVAHRGDVLAQFRRERTKRRFLKFLDSKGIKVVKIAQHAVDSAWKAMTPPVLPTYEDEKSPDRSVEESAESADKNADKSADSAAEKIANESDESTSSSVESSMPPTPA